MELRKKNIENRKEFRGDRAKIIIKYKKRYLAKFGKKIDTIARKSPEKLNKVLDRIDSMENKIEENIKLTDKQKEKIFSQLIAIKEMIEDKIEESELNTDDELDIEVLLED